MALKRRRFLGNTATALAGTLLYPGASRMVFANDFDTSLSNALSGGLPAEKDLVFPGQPENPEMRESVNIWLFAEDGSFAFPRMALEAEAWSWDKRMYDSNFAFAGGRVMKSFGWGAVPSPIDDRGQPAVFGGGPLTFRCIEPFKRWLVSFDGEVVDGDVSQQMDRSFGKTPELVPVRMEAELEMVTPAWVQDRAPEKVAQMSRQDQLNAEFMGVGYRFEHLFRGDGELSVAGGPNKPFRSVGSRIHRQSVRPSTTLANDWLGHCWQSAVFPDGRAFGCCAYPNSSMDGWTYNDAYVYLDGQMHVARMVKTPWLDKLLAEGDDCSLELEYSGGRIRIGGRTTLTTFTLMTEGPMAGFALNQTGAWYSWDDQRAIGMMERSSSFEVLGGLPGQGA
ncbi:hypothetical protein [Haliea sp. E17]|uniref:hypothetical protein n=1 Tax=Haliea sp. E17 TaxID=3401576 RepID=UPI003AAE9A1E